MGSSRPIELSHLLSRIPRAPSAKFPQKRPCRMRTQTCAVTSRKHFTRSRHRLATDRRVPLDKATDPVTGTNLIKRKVGEESFEQVSHFMEVGT